mgnify:CR=1 FL=1
MEVAMRMVIRKDYGKLFDLILRTDGEVREWLLALTYQVYDARRAVQECYARALSDYMLAESLGLSAGIDVSAVWHDDKAVRQAEERYDFMLQVYDYLKENPHSKLQDIARAVGGGRQKLTRDVLRSLERLGLVRYSGWQQGEKELGYSTADTPLSPAELRIQKAEVRRERYKAKIVSVLLSEGAMEASELHKKVGHTWYYFRNAIFELTLAKVVSGNQWFVDSGDSVSIADEAKARDYLARITDGEP